MIPCNEAYNSFISRIFPEFGVTSSDDTPREVRSVTFQVTEKCNLKCTYCYQHNKTCNAMSFDTAKEFVDLLLHDKIPYCNTTNAVGIVVEFIGGEPFIEIELVDKITSYIVDQMLILNHPWKNLYKFSFSSNGTLYFDPRVQEYLAKYKDLISLSISIDGNKELHDACRLFEDGRGSYDVAIKASLDWINKTSIHGSTKMTLAPDNIRYIYDATVNLIQLGYDIIMLNCVYEDVWSPDDARLMYKELCRVSDYLFENNLHDKIFFRLFEDNIGNPMCPEDDKNYCGGTGSMIALDWQGNVYPCLRYMPSSIGCSREPYAIGKIQNGEFVQSTEHEQRVKCFDCITRRSQSTDECFNCPIASGCGWCSAYNYECFGTPNKRSTGICVMHKARCLASYEFWKRYNEVMGIDEEVVCNLKPEWIAEIKGN